MSVTFKVCKALKSSPNNYTEIRRFDVPEDVITNYEYLLEKISEIFPGLGQRNFTLHWIDSDGDLIQFNTNNELLEALNSKKEQHFKIIVLENAPKSAPETGELHPGVRCDGCDNAVRGLRYKCLVCYDYDLCRTCEDNSVHDKHPMIKIPTPGSFPKNELVANSDSSSEDEDDDKTDNNVQNVLNIILGTAKVLEKMDII